MSRANVHPHLTHSLPHSRCCIFTSLAALPIVKALKLFSFHFRLSLLEFSVALALSCAKKIEPIKMFRVMALCFFLHSVPAMECLIVPDRHLHWELYCYILYWLWWKRNTLFLFLFPFSFLIFFLPLSQGRGDVLSIFLSCYWRYRRRVMNVRRRAIRSSAALIKGKKKLIVSLQPDIKPWLRFSGLTLLAVALETDWVSRGVAVETKWWLVTAGSSLHSA